MRNCRDTRNYIDMNKQLLLCLLLVLVLSGCQHKTPDTSRISQQTNAYEPNWSSLRRHQSPQWLDGMKFGMYFHWGPATVIGDNKEMSRLEAIDQWTAEKYSAKAWVDLMEASGAQFGGPVAWHGCGLLNWDSDITEWNTTKKGPKKDIYGSLAKELRKRNMPVISSFHTGNFYDRMWGPISATNDTYLSPLEDHQAYATMNDGRMSNVIFDAWYARITEAITKYQPDMIWFDTGFGGTVGPELRKHLSKGRLLQDSLVRIGGLSEKYQQRLISFYFNKGIEWNKEVEVFYKSHDIPPGIGMRDIENGNLVGLQYDPWIADIDMSNHYDWSPTWFYNPKNPIKDANTLVDMLVDMTSKNGRMLLNVPPMADGSFHEDVTKELYAIGDWLELNGEAIYGTIPWSFYGEGPTEVTLPGHHGQGKNRGQNIPLYTSKDIRFTQKGKNLYAILLEWPGQQVHIKTLGTEGKLHPNTIRNVRLLGSEAPINWKHTPGALVVNLPAQKPCEFAQVIRIERN